MAEKIKVMQGIPTSMNAAFALDVLLHWPVRHSILLVGDHGVGKDGIVKTAARIQNIPCIDIRLSQNDVGDIKGMPFKVKGRTIFAPPDWMPFKEEEEVELGELLQTVATAAGRRATAPRGILFFNEINRATREVQQAAFEIVLDRTMNTRVLRDGWRIVSAVNGDEHYQVNSMDVAFKSRFYIIKFRPSSEEWLDWAADPEVKPVETKPEVVDITSKEITGPLHPVVTSFISKHRNLLDPSEELLTQAESDLSLQVQNRRAWHMLSDCIKVREALAAVGEVPQPVSKDRGSLDYLLLMGLGYVGPLAATELMRYVETDYQSLSGDIILNKWDSEVEKKIKDIVKAGRVIEMSSYCDMIVDIAKLGKDKPLSFDQKRNLTAFFKLLTKEMRARFYKRFISECRETCLDWYGDKDVQKLVVEALKTPKVKKPNVAKPEGTPEEPAPETEDKTA